MNQPIIGATPTATVPTVARTGAIAHMVRIQALPGSGTPSVTLSGLTGDSAWTTRDRLHAAIVNSGLAWPDEAIAVSVFPHDLPAADTGVDAALAVALLATTGHLPGVALGEVAVLGELGLDGALRPVTDVTARLAVVAAAGIPHAVVPAGNLTDAVRTPGVTVRAARTLRELVDGLRGQLPLLTPAAWPTPPTLPGADLADVSATHPGRRLVEIAAAGGHHLAILGRGTGAVMLAQRLPGLLPDLDEATAAQVAEAYRQAGLLPADAPVLLRPPWQAPHHSVSLPALTGNTRRPGAIALAHGGVLFCDDAAELPGAAIDTLRLVLDQPRIVVTTGGARTEYPARVQLVLATGCPQFGSGDRGGCPPAVHRRYLARLSVLLDRVDIHATLPAVWPATGSENQSWPTEPPGEAWASVAARVAQARAAAAARWSGQSWRTNGEVTSRALQASLSGVPAERFAPLRERIAAGGLSTRGGVRVLRLAWTIADLAGHAHPTADDVAEALWLRTGQVVA